MRALVVGAGKAGSRHARVLESLGVEVEILSRRRSGSLFSEYSTGRLSLRNFDRVVVATETSHHEEFFSRADIKDFSGRLLIEKPGLLSKQTTEMLSQIDTKVAYNLRYLDAIQWVRTELEGQRVLRVSSRAHSYLPAWRDDSGTRIYYSQKLGQGGGALYDLAHEFDYLGYLFSGWKVLASVGGRLGGVTIDADDSWFVLGESSQRAQVSVSLSLLSRLEVRDLTIDTELDSFLVNLRTGTFTKNGVSRTGNQIVDTYELMHHEFVAGTNLLLPSVEENQATLSLIESARTLAILQNEGHA